MLRPVLSLFLVSAAANAAQCLIVLREQPSRSLVEYAEGASRLRVLAAQTEEARQPAVREARQSVLRELDARYGPRREAVARRLESLGAQGIRQLRLANLIVADLPGSAPYAAAADPDVAEVAPTRLHQALLDTSVPALGAPAFWNRGITGASQAIAVLDSGIYKDHPAFAGINITGRVFLKSGSQTACFADDVSSTGDLSGHGTHVAGIIASQGTAQYPKLIGVARGLTTPVSLKVGGMQKSAGGCTGRAVASNADVLEAVDWAYANTAVRIFNYSYGGQESADDSVTARMLDLYADTYDLLFVLAAGNDGPASGTINDPGFAYNGIAVANADHHQTIGRADDVIHPASSRGPTAAGRFKPDLAAPGTRINSVASTGDGFLMMTGTSMAAPQIAGSAALLKQAGTLPAIAIKAVLINTASGDGWKPDWGWGEADLDKAQSSGYVFTSSVSPAGTPGSTRYFRGSANGDVRGTLVWNRHISTADGYPYPGFNDLNLMLYSAAGGTLIDGSTTAIQNVEQVRSTAAGDVVWKVAAASPAFRGVNAEPFALAVTAPGFRAVSGPSLSISCAARADTAVTVDCAAANTGDLDAYGVTLRDASGTLATLGVLSAGARVTQPVTVPANTARYSLTLAGNSYGENYTASTQVQVKADTAPPAIAAGARSVLFHYRIGDPAPAGQGVPVDAAAPAPITVAASSSGWLAASPDQSAAPATVTLAADPSGLPAGAYQGSVTIAGPLNSESVAATLLVDTPMIVSRTMTRAEPDKGCVAPPPAPSFLPADDRALVWFTIDNAVKGDRPAAEWISPDGTVFSTDEWPAIRSAGTRCLWAWLDVAATKAASMPGDWQVKVTWNGTTAFVLPFRIDAAGQ